MVLHENLSGRTEPSCVVGRRGQLRPSTSHLVWVQELIYYLVHTLCADLDVDLHHFIDSKLYLDIYLYCWTRHSFFSIKNERQTQASVSTLREEE